jgi:superfamily I DNA/RNA helicase
VLAGPGTGKTRTLVARIAHLLAAAVEPRSILALTFTNKAAGELRDRLGELGPVATVPWAGTFHSFALALVREHSELVGRKPGSWILDEDERRERWSDLGWTHELCEEVERLRVDPGNLAGEAAREAETTYRNWLRRQNALDFDELILEATRLLEENPTVLCGLPFRHVLVDEYQDINPAQYSLLRLLAPPPRAPMFAVGDPNQSIYAFRGADVRIINHYATDYAGGQVYALSSSYRCSRHILKASAQVVARGGDGAALEGLEDGVPTRIVACPTDRSEAEYVARRIEEMMGGLRFFSIDSDVSRGRPAERIEGLADFAVLCRTAGQMAPIEKALSDHAIPYERFGEESYLRREPFRTLLAALRATTCEPGPYLAERLSRAGVRLGEAARAVSGAGTVVAMIEALGAMMGRKTVADPLFPRLLETAASFRGDVEGFLAFALLGRGVDVRDPRRECVSLMTIHAAKGLEFPCVFVVGCEDGLLPFSLLEGRWADTEEERRLLYVAMTRARGILFLTHAERRTIYGRTLSLPRSPFLDAIDRDLVSSERPATPALDSRARDRQLTLF